MFYIIDNKDWDYESKNKYGYVHGNIDVEINKIQLKKRLDSGKEFFTHKTFIHIFQFKQNENYLFNYSEIDKIFSKAIISDKIQEIEQRYNCKFPLLYKIKNYLIKSEYATEFISKKALSY